MCWGANEQGQLGVDSGGLDVEIPTYVSVSPNNGNISVLDLVAYGGCALGGGDVFCWGGDGLFDGQGFSSNMVIGSGNVVGLFAGWLNVCAVNDSGDTYCWGSYEYGQLGNNSLVNSKAKDSVGLVETEQTFTYVGVGGNSICAVNELGRVYCWGYPMQDWGTGWNGYSGEELNPVQVAF